MKTVYLKVEIPEGEEETFNNLLNSFANNIHPVTIENVTEIIEETNFELLSACEFENSEL